MKKALTALIVMMLVFSVSISCADVYEKPILFRNLAWESSYADVLQELPNDKDTVYDIAAHTYAGGIDYLMKGGERKSRGDCGFRYYSSNYSWTVAGYPLSKAGVAFVYVPNEDGTLNRDPDSARFFLGEYTIAIRGEEEKQKAVEDLVQKLTRLYGDVDYTGTPWDTYYSWYGADGTIVSLVDPVASYGKEYEINIRYSYEGTDKLLDQAQAALDFEFSLITDGL